jgi:hypothetical protein
VEEGEENKEKQERELYHVFQTIGVEGIGPGLVKKLVEGGMVTVKRILEGKDEECVKCIGVARGTSLRNQIKEKLDAASPVMLMVASNKLPRGIGEKKLRGLFSVEEDYRLWTKEVFKAIPVGWSEESLVEVLGSMGEVRKWIEEMVGKKEVKSKEQKITQPKEQKEQNPKEQKGVVVFTGVRDKELEERMKAAGWEIGDGVTKRTTLLVVADKTKETVKTKKAREMGIEIEEIGKIRIV